MISPIVFALLSTALSAVLDPSLTEWRLLTQNEERVMFPLRDYILEVKAFRPDVYNTNPSYGELFRTDKATTMMMLLQAGNWNNKVGRLVWNTIKYDRGFDVNIEECNARYQAYRSFPAGGKKEQIWAWNFNQDDVELTCDGELQFSQHFDEGAVNPRKPGLPQSCRALGNADVDRITFRHMEGYYIRGLPMDNNKGTTPPPVNPTTKKITTVKPTTKKITTVKPTTKKITTVNPTTKKINTVKPTTKKITTVKPTTKKITTVKPTTKKITTVKPTTKKPTTEASTNTMTPDNVVYNEEYSTCDCWTPECGYCTNMECTVKQDLVTSEEGIQVASKLRRKKLNSIVLYNEDGKEIGKFQWNLRGIWMTGCISCMTPVHLRRAKADEGQTTWSFSIKDGIVRITINGEHLYEHALLGECKERYAQAKRFAFYDMTCENTFLYRPSQMEAGERITPDCAGTCPQR